MSECDDYGSMAMGEPLGLQQHGQQATYLDEQLIFADAFSSKSGDSRSTAKSSRSASLENDASMAPATVPVAIMGRWV
jgi:hypothetical protein